MSATATRERCARCERPLPQCYCGHITTLSNRWPVWICQHPRESRHALGTARIAALSLEHCILSLCPEPANQAMFPASPALPALIYPGEDALPIEALQTQDIRPLLFLDGTWRKAQRMLMESSWLQSLPRYRLQASQPSRYRIRRAPRPDALSTLEAIVSVLGTLEGDEQRFTPLLSVMDHLLEEQIARMGEAVYRRNYRLR